jgi:hypothetical protein
MRETGYYWVYDRTRNYDDECRDETDFLKINETRIKNPDEK